MRSRSNLSSTFAWRARAALAGLATLGGRYHDELGLADRCIALGRPRREAEDPIGRWEAALDATPDRAICHSGLAAALRRAGRTGEAAKVVSDALDRFPDDLGTIVEGARVAERDGGYARAHTLWAAAAARVAPRPLWSAGAAHSLLMLGRYEEAQHVLARARRSHPRHRGLMAVECMLASAREDWPAAIALWSDFYRRFPDYPNAWEFLGRAIHAGKMSEIDAPTRFVTKAARQANVALVEDEALRDLLLGFESLGENCEFGLVQRRYGAEPFGLFRWNIVWIECLIPALAASLQGLGDPEHTELVILDNREFFVQDRRWYLGRHTFKFEGQTTHDELLPKICDRIASLRTRFLETLAEASRIFVYCSDGLTAAELDALHEQLARFGPNRLLSVQPAAPTNASPFRGAAGEVRRVAPGRYVGFLTRRGIGPDGTWNIAWEDWVSICRTVSAMEARDGATAETGEPKSAAGVTT